MKLLLLIIAIFSASSMAFNLPFLSKDNYTPLIAVSDLDLTKYAGVWYEIGRLPYIFEANCYCNIANYTLNSDGTVGVRNTCNWGSATGKLLAINGQATADDPVNGTVTTGRLTVEFFKGISKAPYYVIDLDENYQWALVGSPNRDYLWILSRTTTISDDLYNQLIQTAVADQFDVSKFVKTYQGDTCERDQTSFISI
jgi:apolipoprotein D and lipocalin family protein